MELFLSSGEMCFFRDRFVRIPLEGGGGVHVLISWSKFSRNFKYKKLDTISVNLPPSANVLNVTLNSQKYRKKDAPQVDKI